MSRRSVTFRNLDWYEIFRTFRHLVASGNPNLNRLQKLLNLTLFNSVKNTFIFKFLIE